MSENSFFFFFFEVYTIVHDVVYLFTETNRVSQHLCVLFLLIRSSEQQDNVRNTASGIFHQACDGLPPLTFTAP